MLLDVAALRLQLPLLCGRWSRPFAALASPASVPHLETLGTGRSLMPHYLLKSQSFPGLDITDLAMQS